MRIRVTNGFMGGRCFLSTVPLLTQTKAYIGLRYVRSRQHSANRGQRQKLISMGIGTIYSIRPSSDVLLIKGLTRFVLNALYLSFKSKYLESFLEQPPRMSFSTYSRPILNRSEVGITGRKIALVCLSQILGIAARLSKLRDLA
jgi:hypothetical protein